jgi:hypothetical protein
VADVVDLARMLDALRGFSPLRRVLLANTGTLQGALSAYFAAPVTVEVVSQRVDGEAIERVVDLVCKELGVVACHAETTATVTDLRIRQLLTETGMGIGQITALLGLRTTFELGAAGEGGGAFWRTYRLTGEGFSYRITEVFQADLYPDGAAGT